MFLSNASLNDRYRRYNHSFPTQSAKDRLAKKNTPNKMPIKIKKFKEMSKGANEVPISDRRFMDFFQ